MEIYYSIQLLFCFITTFLYILVLICLFQGWRSRGSGVNIPFAKICFITGICDILTLVSNNLFNISPKACLFPEFFKSFEDLFVHIYLFFAWGGGASEGLCVLVIAFNRLSTVISPELSKKYWNSKWIYLIFGFQIIPGILIGCTTLMFEVKWKKTINHCALLAVFIEDNIPRLYFKIAAIFLSFISVLLIIIYSIILIYLKKAHKLQLNISQHSCNRILYRQIIRESRLLTISSIICAVQIIYVGYIALREFTGFDRSYIGASIMGDISAGINPYLLLIFSPIIRKRAFKLLNCKSKVFIKIVKVHTLNHNPNKFDTKINLRKVAKLKNQNIVVFCKKQNKNNKRNSFVLSIKYSKNFLNTSSTIGAYLALPHFAGTLDEIVPSKIPVIAFYGDLSFIYVYDQVFGYKLLDNWNGEYGKENYISFDEERPKFFEKAANIFRSTCSSVVHDMIKVLSYSPNKIPLLNPTLGYNVAKNRKNQIVFRINTFNGIKRASPTLLMSWLLKRHIKAIQQKLGEKPDEIAFYIFDEFDTPAKFRIQNGLKESCDLAEIECSFVETLQIKSIQM